MHYKKNLRAAATGLLVAALLAACGGGSDGDGDAPAATLKVWSGSTDTQRDFSGVTLADGTYYLLYSKAGDASTVGGAVQGTATVQGEAFASTDALDFSAEGAGIRLSTVAATLKTATFAGSVTPAAGGTAVNFETRTFETIFSRASLQTLAGSYTGNAGFALGVRPAVFTVTGDGAVSSTINGCAISGTATPRTDGNAYDLAIAFGGAPCALPGLAFAGIAYLRPDNGRLYAVARNAATRQSVIFSGAK
jgi:hypothetical protein